MAYDFEAFFGMIVNLNTLLKNSGISVCDRYYWLAVIITINRLFVLCKILAQVEL